MSEAELIEALLIEFSVIDRIRDPQGFEIESKLIQLIEEDAKLESFVSRLFPSGMPTDQSFYERLNELRPWIGFSDGSNDATARLWSHALNGLNVRDQTNLLNSLTEGDRRYVFHLLECLGTLFTRTLLPNDFLQQWLVKLLRCVENDHQGGLWQGVRVLCELRPDDSFDISSSLIVALDPLGIQVASQILGVLRGLEVTSKLRQQIKNFEDQLSCSEDPQLRQCVQQSWAKTASEFGVSMQDVEALIERIEKERLEDLESLLRVFCRVVLSNKSQPTVLERIFDWIASKVTPSLSIETKRHLAFYSQLLPENDNAFDASKWILPIQPVDAVEEMIWDKTISFLSRAAKSSPATFNTAFTQIARTNATEFLNALNRPHAIDRLQVEMKAEHYSDLIANLLFSLHRPCRKLGLFLFDKLSFELIPQTAISTQGTMRVRLLFHEIQTSQLSPVAMARLLVVVSRQADMLDEDFRFQLAHEITLQARNFVGKGLSEFRRLGESIPIVADAISSIEEWFTRLNRARESGIVSMRVSGVHRAHALYKRNMVQRVSKTTQEFSVFRDLSRTVYGLYGGAMSRYVQGTLSPPIPFTEHGATIEVPFLETMDPEDLAMRRLLALESILQITREIEASERSENED